METLIKSIVYVVLVVSITLFFAIVLAFPVKWCWNYVMPYLFNFKEIDAWQAWCLLFLSGMLFKSSLNTTKG
jgi:hypothetical protein